MPKPKLESQLFRDDHRLQSCLHVDSSHVKFGDKGDFVFAIQMALMTIDHANIDPLELKEKSFGFTTKQAVLNYKGRLKIINTLYEQSVDPIVGKMTIERLDDDLIGKKPSADPIIDPGEPARIQALLARERPGVSRIVDRVIDLLREFRDDIELKQEEPGRLIKFELANPLLIDALRQFCGMVFTGDIALVKALIGQYEAFRAQLPNLPRDQKALGFAQFVSRFPGNVQIKPDGPDFPPAVSDPPNGMFFSPRYRDVDVTQSPLFRGLAPATLELIQLHEMGHFYFGFVDGNPQGQPFRISKNFAQTYEFIAKQAVFHIRAP